MLKKIFAYRFLPFSLFLIGQNPALAEKPAAPVQVAAARPSPRVKPLPAPVVLPVVQQDQIELEMYVGETRVLPQRNAGRLAVGNGKVLSASVLDDKEILLIANDAGTTSLHIWTKDGRNQRMKVRVLPADMSHLTREIIAFLGEMPNVKARAIGDKVVVEGDDLSDSNLAKIDELAKRFPQIVNFTNQLGWEKMVVMDVKVVEFPTNALREIGLKWGTTGGVAVGGVWGPIRRGDAGPYQINLATGQANPAPITSPSGGPIPIPSGLNVLSIVNMGLNAQLNLMAQNGTAAILAEPTLSARSGSTATFDAGGEFPYEISTINGPTVQFKAYGVILKIEPRVDHKGVIRAKITSEVSSIDSSITTRAGPALTRRKTETEFNVRDGETIVLSGLLSRESSSTIDKVPVLGDLPILGALFRSKRFQNKETELVVFVTPRVSTADDPAQAKLKQRVEKKVDGFLNPPPPPPGEPARWSEEDTVN